MGPESAKSYRGQELVYALPDPEGKRSAEQATQEVDDGRRGKGYLFGAFKPVDGAAFTKDYERRTIANWVDFLGLVEEWIPPEIEHVYAILDNLNVHRATDLNLIEPWWKILRSLALKGRRFETWEELAQAVRDATAYWNKHRHPFVWGRRRRHRPHRRSGVGLLPRVA